LYFGSLNKAYLCNSRYAEGPFYALRGRVISGILRAGLVPRLGGPEGVVAHQNNTFVPGVLVCLAGKLWHSHVMRALKPPQSTRRATSKYATAKNFPHACYGVWPFDVLLGRTRAFLRLEIPALQERQPCEAVAIAQL
jgi:hypothetical protein